MADEQMTNPEADSATPQTDSSTNGPLPGKPEIAPESKRGFQLPIWACVLIIAGAGLAAYVAALPAPFHLEDERVLVQNQPLHSPLGLAQAAQIEDGPRFVALASLAANWWLTPNNPLAFRVVNLALHLANGLLLYIFLRLLCRRLPGVRAYGPVSLFAGLALVLHPLNTEAVNCAVGRGSLLGVGFALLSLVLFLHATRDSHRLDALAWGLSVLAFILGWASHSAVLCVPALILALDWICSGPGLGKRIGWHCALWGILVTLVLVRATATPEKVDLAALATSPVSSATAATGLLDGLTLLVSPGALNTAHLPVAGGAAAIAGLAASLAAVLIVTCAALVAQSPLALAGILILGGGLSAGAEVYATGTFTERSLYMATAGIALVFPWLLSRDIEKEKLRAVITVAVALILAAAGYVSFMRNSVWRDPATLWQDAAAKAPDNPLPWRVLGGLSLANARSAMAEVVRFSQDGQSAGAAQQQEAATKHNTLAETYFTRAIDLAPADAEAWAGLGTALQGLNRLDESEQALLNALRSRPSDFHWTLRLAQTAYAQSVTSSDRDTILRAVDYFRRAEKLRPLPAEAALPFVSLLASLGNLDGAEQALLRIDAQGDAHKRVANEIAAIRQVRGKLMATEKEASRSADPSKPDAKSMLLNAQVLVGHGHLLQASYVLERALLMEDPPFEAWSFLGTVRARMGQAPAFLSAWGDKAIVPEDGGNPWLALAEVCLRSGTWQGARHYLESQPAQASGITDPLLALAGIARDAGQLRIASQLLEEAAELRPTDPRPLLLLCDLAIAMKNPNAAAGLLQKAEERGASAAEIESRRQQLANEVPDRAPKQLTPTVR